jgi:type II secretory pathway pseudopilin PulG
MRWLVTDPTVSSRPRCTRQRAETGSTLIEVLIAIMVLGIGVAALVGGLVTSISASSIHRDAATRDTIIRSYAEQLKADIEGATTTLPGGSWCATPSSTIVWTTPTSSPSDPPTSGYIVSQQPGPCPYGVSGAVQVQTVTLKVESPDGGQTESMDVVVRQP